MMEYFSWLTQHSMAALKGLLLAIGVLASIALFVRIFLKAGNR